jgi:hypothetical protein
MTSDNFSWLASWYASQCNSDWEHSYGVKIDTLDNPGWTLKIDLADTGFADRAFEKVSRGETASDFEEWSSTGGWLVAEVKGSVFEAACGPLDLSEAVGVFRQWVEARE